MPRKKSAINQNI